MAFAVAVKSATQHGCLAIGRVRYPGEPVAVVLARDRPTAEDNAVADALAAAEISLPLMPQRILEVPWRQGRWPCSKSDPPRAGHVRSVVWK